MSNAHASLSDTSLSRRTIIAAGAVTIATAAGPAVAMPAFDADAGLLALRSRWLESSAAFNTALEVKGVTDTAKFAAEKDLVLPSWPAFDHPNFVSETVRIAKLRSDAEEAVSATVGADVADAEEDATSDAETAVVDEIAATPARTLAGVAFKIEVSEEWLHGKEELIDSIMADIAAFAAAHPTLRI